MRNSCNTPVILWSAISYNPVWQIFVWCLQFVEKFFENIPGFFGGSLPFSSKSLEKVKKMYQIGSILVSTVTAQQELVYLCSYCISLPELLLLLRFNISEIKYLD